MIDVMDMDGMTNGLYFAGETCFRRGEFRDALDLLLRCVRAPRNAASKLSEAKSYHLLGMIYGYLGQEILAKENLLKGLKMGLENEYSKEVIESYMSLACLHAKLNDLEQALDYQVRALPFIEELKAKEAEAAFKKKMRYLAHRGILCARLGRMEKAAESLTQVEELAGETCENSREVTVLNLAIRVFYEKQDMQALGLCLKRLLELPILEEGFFKSLEFYFDICKFFLEKGMRQEVHTLLEYMKSYYDMLPLASIKYRIHNFELTYAKQYGGEEAQWEVTQKLFAILPEYEAEQQWAKRYSFEYIEYLHEERDLSAKMEQQSKLDPMTGLFNKFTMEVLIDEYFKQMDGESVAALLLIDMDHFKKMNDTLGHLAGDAILSDTAAVIRHFFKGDALCGRIGGDEFMVFVKDASDISSLLLQAEFLRQEIAKTATERNIPIAIQASVGIAVSTAGYYDYASIFCAADEALHRAKKEGRNKICVIE